MDNGNHCFFDSAHSRNRVLEHLNDYGTLPVEHDTWTERNNVGDFENYPVLLYNGGDIIAVKTNDNRLGRMLDKTEFMGECGVKMNQWSGNRLKFHFM
jgi:hypothetical protein